MSATLECSHCGGVAIESANGMFGDGDGERCITCGFPGHVTVSQDYDHEGNEVSYADWSCLDGNDDVCADPVCSECEGVRLAMGLPLLRDEVEAAAHG